jgi:hypothetical protein
LDQQASADMLRLPCSIGSSIADHLPPMALF